MLPRLSGLDVCRLIRQESTVPILMLTAPTEFRVILVLAMEQGRAIGRDQIQQRVWGVPYRQRDRSIDVCVRGLREKLDDRSETHRYIHTHYGVGYRFEAVARERVPV